MCLVCERGYEFKPNLNNDDIFLHTRGPSSKFVWVANPYRICGTRYREGQKEVKSAREIEAFYSYFNGTGIWGGETLSVLYVCNCKCYKQCKYLIYVDK